MPEVPAHITDGEIAHLWGMNPCIRSIQMEPFVNNSKRYQRVTIHFDDFPSGLREQIENGYYKTNTYNFHYGSGGNYLLESSYLIPCERPQSPRTEYSHVVALQLQDVVRDQLQHISNLFGRDDDRTHQIDLLHHWIKSMEKKHTKEIEYLETRINELETRIQEETKLQLDINQSNIEEIDQLEHRIQSQEDYNHHLQERIIALEAKMASDAREKEELEYKMAAVIEWCSQPVWKRTSAFVFPKESEERFVSEV